MRPELVVVVAGYIGYLPYVDSTETRPRRDDSQMTHSLFLYMNTERSANAQVITFWGPRSYIGCHT